MNKTELTGALGPMVQRGLAVSVLALAFACANRSAQAQIPYPGGGENSANYTFTASATGDIIGYFAGSGAAYHESVALIVNGGPMGGFGLPNYTGSSFTPVGTSFNFGHVNAGDVLTFVLSITSVGPISPPYAYSDPTLNAAFDGTPTGHQHVYSTAAGPNDAYAGSPAGTYVAFEDLRASDPPDWNYFDDTFVFTNVAIPDSGLTVALLGMGMLGIGWVRRMVKR